MKLKIFLLLMGISLPSAAQLPSLFTVPSDAWPTYNGDYSGRRFSELAEINQNNVRALTMGWAFPTHVDNPIKGTPLLVDDVLYLTVPDHVWALDARTGRPIWHFARPSEGNHIAQRGVAYYGGRVFTGTPDAHLIALDAKSGKQVWDVKVADSAFGYYISMAPLLVKGKLIVGTSGDQADVPHSLTAFDPETGAIAWRWNSLPKADDPAAKSWPNAEALNHGGGPVWITGTYDPDLNLLYWGTGNPHPVLAGVQRAGDNLYTCSIVALNPDTGKLVWYFQPSPHDTHDWDAIETPVIFDAEFNGSPKKLLAQASRNGYFFVLDRTNGKALLTKNYVGSDWASGVDTVGRPIPDPAKEPQPNGAFTKIAGGGGTNWMAPSFDPQTGLFYVNALKGYSVWYLALNEQRKAEDHQGGSVTELWEESLVVALDYRTGEARWTRKNGVGTTNAGMLTTAGGLLFTGDTTGNLLALDAKTGDPLWHTQAGASLSNAPMTYSLDGKQYVLTGVDGVLYAWTLPAQ